MAGILKVDTIQNANASNLVTQANATTITVGAAGQTVSLDGGIIKSGSTTLTIGTSGQTVSLASGASSSGFGATYNGAVNWDTTPKTTTVTATSGVGYFINTTAGAVTVNLPAGTAGAIVALSDYAGTWNINATTVSANGTDKIGGVASAPVTLNTKGQAVTLVYVDSTRGWINTGDATYIAGNAFITATGGTILTCGNYKTHVFTGSGCFVVTYAGTPAGSNSVEYMVVAGGGGGSSSSPGNWETGGGAGAGGFRQNYPSPATTGFPVTATAYPIIIGGGGAGGTTSTFSSNPGNPSSFSSITSAGGGGGSGYAGGSGGGSAGGQNGGSAGAGNTPPVSPPQGNPGGQQTGGTGPSVGAPGGGGAGAPGTPGQSGPGGVGSYWPDGTFGPTAPSYGTPGPVGSTRYFAGGGGGYQGGSGGAGGGGNGGSGGGAAQNATSNTGGGGGSTGQSGPSGGGGSGIVLIRYKYQ